MVTTRALSLLLVALLLNLSFLHPKAAANSNEEKIAAKVKAGIAKLGTGKQSRVIVKLRDKTKITGYVSKITEDGFIVVNEDTGSITNIPYQQVKQVKGNNVSTGVAIAVTIGFILVMSILIAVTYR